MMEQASNALVAVCVLSALVFLIYGPWQWICTDWARQIVFEKRDKLFDMARAGEISFHSREYKAIRSSLESSIRFAHDLSWPLLLAMMLSRRVDLDRQSEMSEATGRIENPEVHAKIRRIVSSSQRAMILMVIFKSPFAVICFPIVALCALAAVFIEGCRKHVAHLVRLIGNVIQVEAEGFPEMQIQKSRAFRRG
ncbi:hypothetical protein RPMA_18215 [Tardiphaga alba]|uniref:Uncharacterized protein n=1 Tax=Tardiphaga alba TaxID=340268 RepID=A0ABX8A9X8_9BRAD|nr:hypothetical protein [Tardiphaga alba]QUS40553.1 hypothetical protein RPMA_18215 [Tardiphaga alba]